MSARHVFLPAYAVFLVGLLLWPLASPGALIHRDMVVVPHPSLSLSAFGCGDLPARNAPQDGVLALAGQLIDASFLARLLLFTAALLGAYGAVALARYVQAGTVGTAAAMTITIYNPFVVERLLQGHWSLVMAAWLLPGIAAWGFTGQWRLQVVALWLASLTPTGAITALIVGTCTTTRRWFLLCVGLLTCLPWLIPALLHPATSSPDGAWAFAPRAENHVGVVGSVAGLGGIWNSQAVPPSREVGFAMAGVALFCVLLAGAWRQSARRALRPLIVLAAVALGCLLISYIALPFTSWIVTHIPGAALWRDSQKLVMFAIPAYTALAASIQRRTVAAVAIALAFLQVPDAARVVTQITPVSADPAWSALAEHAAGRDVFIPDSTTMVHDGSRLSIDPRTKALSTVENGELRVGGRVVDPPSQRYRDAQHAWATGDRAQLERLGIGMVVDNHNSIITETAAPPRRGARFALGVFLTMLWLAVPLVCLPWRFRQRGK